MDYRYKAMVLQQDKKHETKDKPLAYELSDDLLYELLLDDAEESHELFNRN